MGGAELVGWRPSLPTLNGRFEILQPAGSGRRKGNFSSSLNRPGFRSCGSIWNCGEALGHPLCTDNQFMSRLAYSRHQSKAQDPPPAPVPGLPLPPSLRRPFPKYLLRCQQGGSARLPDQRVDLGEFTGVFFQNMLMRMIGGSVRRLAGWCSSVFA